MEPTYEQLKKRVEELERQKEFLENIFDAIPVNLFVKDTDCKYCYTNKICDMLNGVERGMLRGKTDFDLQNSEEIARSFYEDDLAIMRDKKGSRMLSPTMCGDEIKYYDIFKEPVLDRNGNVQGVMGMVIDPGDSGVKNDRLGDDSRYESAFGSVETVVFDYDLVSGKAIYLQKPDGTDIFDEGAVLLDSIREKRSVMPEDIKLFEDCVEKIRSGEEQVSQVIRFCGGDKDVTWCRLSLGGIYDKELKPVRAFGVIRPLQEAVVKAEKLRISTDRVKNRVASILGRRYDAFVYINTADGYYDIIERKGVMEGLSTSGSTGALKKYCEKTVDGQDLPHLAEALKAAEENGKGFASLEFRYTDENGICRWKEGDFFRVLSESDTSEILVTVFDVDDIVKEKQDQRLKEINNGIIDILSTVVEFRSVESGDHIRRIKGFTKILLKYANMMQGEKFTPEQVDVISSASAMHDIGKVAIPDSILLKPGRLTPEEFEQMKQHTLKGCEILDSMSSLQDESYYSYSYEICRHHHERYDGKGYPDGLKGDEIPLVSQIVSVADVYDALISKRVYKDAYSLDEAYNMIINGECGVFSPYMLECFKNARQEMENFAKTL